MKRVSPAVFALFVAFFVIYATATAFSEKEASVAVWDIENMSPGGFTGPDIGELLSAKVIEILKGKNEYNVVERERLVLALEELNLGTSDLANKATRLRLGRLVGASLMVFGGYFVLGDKMRLDIRLVDVETGGIVRATQRTTSAGDLVGWLQTVEEATAEMFDQTK